LTLNRSPWLVPRFTASVSIPTRMYLISTPLGSISTLSNGNSVIPVGASFLTRIPLSSYCHAGGAAALNRDARQAIIDIPGKGLAAARVARSADAID
jgi:hypothetical protein